MKLFFLLSLIQLAFASPDLRSAKALKTELKTGLFSARLSEGYHFNDKAPNGIQLQDRVIKPTILLPRDIRIENLPADAAAGTAHLYVCDDKVTFCEMHSIALGKDSSSDKNKIVKTKPVGADAHGFIVGDLQAAMKKAQAENKMLLVDFGARWCPACLRLENEIFSDKEFKTKTKPYVKAKIDIDTFSSSVLKEKYNIKGVPTLLFLKPDGKEIARFYDYQPMSFINEVLAEVQKYPFAIEDLEKKDLNSEMRKSLAKRYFFSDQNSKAVTLMEKITPRPKEYWFAKIGEAEALASHDPTKKKKYIEVLKTAIQADPESSRSILWRLSLVNALDGNHEEMRIVAQESNKLTDKLLSREDILEKAVQSDILGEYTGLEGFYVAMMNAEVSEKAGFEPQKAWEKVTVQGEKYKINSHMPGASLRLLSAMMSAEHYDKALTLVNGLLKRKPQDGDLQRRKMRVLTELKKYDKAISLGEQALKNSYGMNEFFVVEPLAKAYLMMNRKDEAKKLISRYLSRNEINFPDLKGIKGRLEKLKLEL